MNDFDKMARELLQAGYRYAFALTHCEPDAEDLVQEAWLRTYRKVGKNINRPLLFTAVRNLFIDDYRRRKVISFESFEMVEQQIPSSNGSPSDGSAIDLHRSLGKLRTEEREAIFLNFVEGYTAQEIADFRQCPRGTVLGILQRAKKKLARMLDDGSPLEEDRMRLKGSRS